MHQHMPLYNKSPLREISLHAGAMDFIEALFQVDNECYKEKGLHIQEVTRPKFNTYKRIPEGPIATRILHLRTRF